MWPSLRHPVSTSEDRLLTREIARDGDLAVTPDARQLVIEAGLSA